MGYAASTICLPEEFDNFFNRETAARRHIVGGIARSPQGHRSMLIVIVQQTGTVRGLCGLCGISPGCWGDCTALAMTSHDARTEFRQVAAETL